VPDFGSRCEANDECIFATCLFANPDDRSGYCTRECDDFSDCPAFWDCSEIASGAGKRCVQ
jgi:hypothetical protein